MTVKEMGPAVATWQAFSAVLGKRAVQQIADVTLVENSSAGHRSQIFAAQTVEAHHEADTVITGVDGHTSRGRHPSKVLWLGGSAKDLVSITDVKIVAVNGEALVDGQLNITYGGPRDVVGGVEFFVLKPA